MATEVRAVPRVQVGSNSSNFCRDTVDACADFIDHEIFGTVQATEICDLQRQGQACGFVQERGQVLCRSVPVPGRCGAGTQII